MSESMKQFYINDFGFRGQRVKVTGYGRVDKLVLNNFDRASILKKYGLPDRKIVLVAPTWTQDDKSRNIMPFGVALEDFYSKLEKTGKKNDATIIFRTHLNSGDEINWDQSRYVKIMPSQCYPVAEEFLYIADMLITDWSSIAIDYLVLKSRLPFEY